jgi:hypothetical protein
MSMTARRNFLWSFVIIGIGVMMLLLALDVLPTGIADIMERSWAVLLVIAGLNMLFGERIRYGNWIALALSLALLGGVVYLGYINRIDEVRTENVQTLDPIPLGDHIQGVNVNVSTLNTVVKFEATADVAKVIGARFVGSKASDVNISVQENESGIVNLVISETRASSLPDFNDVGISELVVTLPAGVAINDLQFTSERGQITLDFRVLNVPRFNIVSQNGDIELYMPIAMTPEQNMQGDITVTQGNLMLVVPSTIPMSVLNAPSDGERREMNLNVYQVLLEGSNVTIETDGFNAFQIVVRVDVPRGTLTIKAPEELTQ